MPILAQSQLSFQPELLWDFINHIMTRTRIRSGVILVAVYLLWTVQYEVRPDPPILQNPGPDSGYLVTLIAFKLAQGHIEDARYNLESWFQVLNSWLVPEGHPPRGAFQPKGVLTSVEYEILTLLDHSLDIRLASSAFNNFLTFLGPDALATLGLQPSGLSLELQTTSSTDPKHPPSSPFP